MANLSQTLHLLDIQAGGPGSGRHKGAGTTKTTNTTNTSMTRIQKKLHNTIMQGGHARSWNQGKLTAEKSFKHNGQASDGTNTYKVGQKIGESSYRHTITTSPDGSWAHTERSSDSSKPSSVSGKGAGALAKHLAENQMYKASDKEQASDRFTGY